MYLKSIIRAGIFLFFGFIFLVSIQQVLADCTGTINVGKWSTVTLGCDNASSISCSQFTTQTACNAANVSQTPNSYGAACRTGGSGSCAWIDYSSTIPGEPGFSNPPSDSSSGSSSSPTCASVGGTCMSQAGMSDCFETSFTHACSGSGQFCCAQVNPQCTQVYGNASCVSETTCNGTNVGEMACGAGSVCCVPKSNSSNSQKPPAKPAPTSVASNSGSSTGSNTGNSNGNSGNVCSSSKVPDSKTPTYNECGCTAGGVTVGSNYSVKVEKFTYSNASCPGGTQYACDVSSEQLCTNGCSAGQCNPPSGSSAKNLSNACSDGTHPGDTKTYTDNWSYKPQCKVVVEKVNANCTKSYYGSDGKTPIDQAPKVDCSSIGSGSSSAPQPTTAPTTPPNNPSTGKGSSSLCTGSYHCNACSIPSGNTVGTQQCFNSQNQLCLTQSCSNQSSNPIYSQTCSNTPKCTDGKPGDMSFTYVPCSTGSQCTGVGGGGCGYCQTAVSTQSIGVQSVVTPAPVSADSWLGCMSNESCNMITNDVNHDGTVNILDFNALLNK